MHHLVTGGTGFLGRAVAARLPERDDRGAVDALVGPGARDRVLRRVGGSPGAEGVVPVGLTPTSAPRSARCRPPWPRGRSTP